MLSPALSTGEVPVHILKRPELSLFPEYWLFTISYLVLDVHARFIETIRSISIDYTEKCAGPAVVTLCHTQHTQYFFAFNERIPKP